MAVLKAKFNAIWRDKIKVSKIIDVIMPLIIARIIMPITGQAILLYWKKAIVPKSPIEQPNKHQKVFLDA
jgi:hypothetical protein